MHEFLADFRCDVNSLFRKMRQELRQGSTVSVRGSQARSMHWDIESSNLGIMFVMKSLQIRVAANNGAWTDSASNDSCFRAGADPDRSVGAGRRYGNGDDEHCGARGGHPVPRMAE